MNRLLAEIVGALLATLTVIGGYFYGQHVGEKHGYDKRDTETAIQIAKLNAENQQKTNSLVQQIADKDAQLQKEKDDAKKEIAKRDTAIATGKLQLYVRTKATANTTCPNAPTTSGPDTATAQLDPAFAQSLVAITDDGDQAIRKLNACVAVYNQVRGMINGNPTTR
jgi:prophage endopeptidase